MMEEKRRGFERVECGIKFGILFFPTSEQEGRANICIIYEISAAAV